MIDQDDDDLPDSFMEAMSGVTPLKKGNKQADIQKPVNFIPESTLQARRAAAQKADMGGGAALSEAWVEPIEPEQKLSFSRPGIQQTRMRQLRQGLIEVRYQVDLHGYKVEEARELVYEFLQVSRQKGYSCVRIVHGKSHRTQDRQSTIKSHVNHWLKQLSDVLAFCSAPPSEGGTGSVLVLLKRKQ
ncbi:DNA mismatch repair protein MutS [Endozoicomonas sp. OPT23]|uniref:Smr/MutS family protein n=1 Tax=Endozoicomonas sp. OPT23 TaxID=2072845 RepID=UPI00129BCC8D|nr:Smr/MutS family protein [Endozoicomonas sp. OPT23]MRI34564.1 DNA mismatch repair protein MutS [Endozoicomonas sp. OPT23]